MDWNRALHRLENDVIKIDVMASEDSDFMATHVPFKTLSVRSGGRLEGPIKYVSEEDLYHDMVENPKNQHRLVMVLGSNGAGKSHLIRWLRARFESSGMAEKQGDRVIFIRRLGNNFRGAVSQLLDAGIIHNADLENRLRSFISAADSQDEARFMSTIYSNFTDEVYNDKNDGPYSVAERRDLAAFLSDSRVRLCLMADDGPISRCYAQIAKSTERVFVGEPAFSCEDFDFKNQLVREVQKEGSKEADRFMKHISADEEEAEQLAGYLNGFTSAVINRCANISQGDTREVFAHLRAELKRQGKNLTIFIEDFTSFRNVDSELITVLATEHGGSNDGLCRVTAIVGITDGYYSHFKDNFTDRVTHHVVVDQEAYSQEAFLIEMTARYLNAAFVSRDSLRDWFNYGADPKQLPVGDFKPPIVWENIDIAGNELTLYPFNSRALNALYKQLPYKNPREFLRMLRDQLSAFIHDQIKGIPYWFPLPIRDNILIWSIPEHGSYIERLGYNERDQQRLSNILCTWGVGNAYMLKKENELFIGDVQQSFFNCMGLKDFKGIPPQGPISTPPVPPKDLPIQPPPKIPRAQLVHEQNKKSLDEWYQQKKRLAYSADARASIRQFLASAINWQAEGVSAYIAKQRLQSNDFIYIDGQIQDGIPEQAMVKLERKSDNYDVLRALLEFNYYNSWNFNGAAYYQLILAEWVEKIKTGLILAVTGQQDNEWPVYCWAMAVEYYRLAFLGMLAENNSDEELLRLIMNENNLDLPYPLRENSKWSSMIEWISQRKNDFQANKTLLIEYKRTWMGIVTEHGGAVHIYHTGDIIDTLEYLKNKSWFPCDCLPAKLPRGIPTGNILAVSFNLLRQLAARLNEVIQDEQERNKKMINKLKELVGDKLIRSQFYDAGNTMLQFLDLLNDKNIPYQEVKRQHVVSIKEEADFLSLCCERIAVNIQKSSIGELVAFYSSNPGEKIADTMIVMEAVQRMGEKYSLEMQRKLKELEGQITHEQLDIDKIKMQIQAIEKKIDALGVYPQ